MPKTKGDRYRRHDEDEPYKRPSSARGYSDGNRRPPASGNHKETARRKEGNDDGHAPCSSFDEMNLKPDLLKGIYAYGFEKPSAIQQRAIRPIVTGRDVIAQSQSGTGKTVRRRKNGSLHKRMNHTCTH
jgi:hypothetical protein